MSADPFPTISPFSWTTAIQPAHDNDDSGETKEHFLSSDFPFDDLSAGNSPLGGEMTSSWVSSANLPMDTPEMNAFGNGSDFSAGLLHHASSTSSLTSLSSLGHSQASSLYVHIPHEPLDFQPSHQSSFASLAPFQEDAPPTIYPAQTDIFMPQAQAQAQAPQLEVQTQGLRSGRLRSSSRVFPYDKRQRSESISIKSEEEELGELLSANSTYSTNPWSASALTGGLNKMTLHHRRTSSASKASPMLSRSRRSSVALHKKQSMDFLASDPDLIMRGSAEDRENAVRADMTHRTELLHSLTSACQQDKAKSLWVRRWLHLSYTWSEGHTVSRQALYHSYCQSCDEYGVRAINSASFGKAIRVAFVGIKTRRLGVRGNSKYHYVSLRPTIRVEADRLNEYGDVSGQWLVRDEDGSIGFQPSGSLEIIEDIETDDDEESSPTESSSSDAFHSLPAPIRPPGLRRHTTTAITQPQVAPIFIQAGFPFPTPEVESQFGFLDFWNSFCHHQEELISAVRALSFDRYEIHCKTFWFTLSEQDMQVCNNPSVSLMITNAMAFSYHAFMESIMEKLHMTFSPTIANQMCRLASNLEVLMEGCLENFDETFAGPKIELAVRAAHLILRFIDLHQLSASLTPILGNQSQVQAMMDSWNSIKIDNIADQCALSCNCNQDVLRDILKEFQAWLSNIDRNGALATRRLGAWADKVLRELQVGARGPQLPLRMLALRTGFVTSQIMRDLTIRSDSAFGLFQLIKTWLDEWVSIKTLLQTALSSQSLNAPPADMTVAIPEGGPSAFRDLNTAVPLFPFSKNATTPRPVME